MDLEFHQIDLPYEHLRRRDLQAERQLLARADRLIVLADASKFAPRGNLVVCPLSRIDTLITDEAAAPEALAMLREAGVETIVVNPDAKAMEAA